MKRRTIIRGAAVIAVAAVVTGGGATAQPAYPDKPVKLIIPYPPGGPTDLLGRLVAQSLSESWGQPVVAENRAGASGTIGSDYVARAKPDGYTLILGNNASHGTYELLNPSTTPYITARDFAPVALVGIAPQVMVVSTGVGVKDIKSFIALAKSRPGQLNYGTSAIGSAPHLAAEMFKLAAGVDLKHIPFNGAAPVMQAIIANTVQMYIGAPSTVMPQVEAGKAVALGALSSERIPSLPQLPTFKENGVELTYNSWFGLLAPAKTPIDILEKINADVNKMLENETIKKQLVDLGFLAEGGDREYFRKVVDEETATTKTIIEAAKIEVK
ncbi:MULTISPECIES: tripartite tricarboxylate transporter substrate binding protein [unclassified Chelatococcus]|uniref:Bug family tripartite tricarboxylate transporter substrate binding protein n=1 Tax=unclassified Chelatococcus TaxID=2638111 RepID=UPI001BCB49C4|nr:MULTISPECIES: tripartite tricarboxylate transporter substrate binding protein [unclassified Chelatococcus]MBS7699958.1 tripartite tricarboxylate transporter substrate binding protein [Chelatococcus sp. YT9]MBX3558617.1 tripartite tricarboxylate transporter substrate binding protein [Chelatococcus sp.]